MTILFLTQYFPPEVGAPQNRLHDLALKLASRGVKVKVLTAMPNYPQNEVYENFKGKWFVKENSDGLDIYRSWIYVNKSRGVISRLLNYFSFVFTSFFVAIFKVGKFDVIFCESPPLFLGITAYLLKLFKRAKLVFNVSDLWPESAEKLGIISNKALLKMSTWLEEFLYRKSDLISGQTKGIVANIYNRFPEKEVVWLPNGVDVSQYENRNIEAVDRSEILNFSVDKNDFLLLYAGIIGHAQGLEVIIQAADLLRDKVDIKFLILGSGPEKSKLQEMVMTKKLKNVIFNEAVSKEKMFGVLTSVQASIIPLRRIDLFKGAIPSKIFEALALKVPVLLGVEGEAYDLFVKEGNCALFFTPENAVELSEKILLLKNSPELINNLRESGKDYVQDKFNRVAIAQKFYDELLKLQVN